MSQDLDLTEARLSQAAMLRAQDAKAAVTEESPHEKLVPQARRVVYAAINSERRYQDRLFGCSLSSGRPGDGSRSLDEFILYINGVANKVAMGTALNEMTPEAKLKHVLKVAALAVHCMEQHGVFLREPLPPTIAQFSVPVPVYES